MATANQISKDNLFANDPESKKAFDYITLLACTTNTNLNRWDITKIFGTEEDNNKLVTNKNEINKRFFETMTARASVPDMDEATDVPGLVEAVSEAVKMDLERQKKTALQNIKGCIDRLNRYERDINAQLHNIAGYQKTLLRLAGEDATSVMTKEIDTVLKQGVWVNPVVADGNGYDEHGYQKTGKFLYLNTAKDVIVKYRNRAAEVDMEVNFGQLAVKIDLSNLYVSVIPYKNNISYEGYYHPHVSDMGGICWGDARGKVVTWQSKFELANIMQMLYSLLLNYNDGNPYVHLYNFQKHSTRKGRTPDMLRHPDKVRRTTTATSNNETVNLTTSNSYSTF
jgi:hypothetical protein